MKYYLFGGMSAAFLLFGFSYLYGLSGSTNLHRMMLGLYGPHAIQFFAAVVRGVGDGCGGAGIQGGGGAVSLVGAGYL